MSGVFHRGEIEVQERAGVRRIADRVGDSLFDRIPPAAVPFLKAQPFVLLGAESCDGRVWATVIARAPDFLMPSDDETRIHIGCGLANDDPLTGSLTVNRAVGLLVIESRTRRRMRLNGRVTPATDDAIEIKLTEVYTNCPKYIQARAYEDAVGRIPGPSRAGDVLTENQRAMISRADTFYIASLHAERGADVSHRGGMPGFVSVTGNRRISWPDYAGNSMFQTLGNLQLDPRAGILMIDDDSGTLLHLSGRVSVDWDEDRSRAQPGAERMVDFDIERVIERPEAFPLTGRVIEYSQYNPKFGIGDA